MAIIKSKHASNFTIIPNEVFKQELSMKAIGLLTYLLSLPHDWIVYKTFLHEQLMCGKYELHNAFKELQAKGYILTIKKHNSKGILEYEHIVYDKPFNGEQPPSIKPSMDEPPPILPRTVKPSTVNQPLQSTNTNKETSTNFKIKIGTACFLDLTAYIKGEGATLYSTVIANRKDKAITPEAILTALNDKYPIYEFTDTNHIINSINACIRVLEANKRKGNRGDNDNRSKMVY